jgi:RHS repeat-associated protein
MNGTAATRSATLRPRIGYCRKHASARFRPSLPADPHRGRRFCTSGPLGYDPSTTHAPDGSINRYYDPGTGQFLSVDPLVDETGQPYAYAGDDPVNETDPTGLWCIFGHNPNGGCRGSATVVNAWHNVDQAWDCLGSACYTTKQGAANLVAGARNTLNYVSGLPPVPAPYPCSDYGAYALGGQVPYLPLLLVPGAGEAAEIEVPVAVGDVLEAGGSLTGDQVQEVITSLTPGNSAGVFTASSEEEIGALYGDLSKGGTPIEPTANFPADQGQATQLPDGTRIQLRYYSGSGGPTIDAFINDGPYLKVHVSPWPPAS